MTSQLSNPQFEDVVRQHAGHLYRYAFWLARNRQQAEDVVQEALLRGWRAFPGLRDRASAKSWLFSIVRNEYYRGVKKNAPHADGVDVTELEIADERVEYFGVEMREALMALPAAYAEPLALQVLGGFSCVEIATLLETTEGATMTRLTLALLNLLRFHARTPHGESGRWLESLLHVYWPELRRLLKARDRRLQKKLDRAPGKNVLQDRRLEVLSRHRLDLRARLSALGASLKSA